MKFPIRTRREAYELGLKTYYTGVPCKRGHDAQRFTATGNCKQCNYEYTRIRTKDLNQRKYDRSKGLKRFEITVPAEDQAMLVLYANSLLMAKQFAPLNQLPSAPPPVQPVTPRPPAFTLPIASPPQFAPPQDLAAMIAATQLKAATYGVEQRDPLTWLNGLGEIR